MKNKPFNESKSDSLPPSPFTPITNAQAEHILRAEVELLKAGVFFDTCHSVKNGRKCWGADWSLYKAQVD